MGGWGTFAIVFEDGHKKYHALDKPIGTPQTGKSPIDIASFIAKKLMTNQSTEVLSPSSEDIEGSFSKEADRQQVREISPEKL